MVERLNQSFQYHLSDSILICADLVRDPMWIQAVPSGVKENGNVEHQDSLHYGLGYGSSCHDCRSDAFHACTNVSTSTLLRLIGVGIGIFARVEVVFDASVGVVVL